MQSKLVQYYLRIKGLNMDNKVLNNLSYGVYVVTTVDAQRPVGCIANCAMQITYDTMCVSINHDNYTNSCIKKSKKFAVSILGEHVNDNIIPVFGFQSSKDIDKFENIKTINVDGLEVIEDSVGYIICELVNQFETETHTVFEGKMTEAKLLKDDVPMTYSYYHQVKKGKSPKAAPTYQEETPAADKVAYRCKICGYIYEGDITKEPDTYVCPICKKDKSFFEKIV